MLGEEFTVSPFGGVECSRAFEIVLLLSDRATRKRGANGVERGEIGSVGELGKDVAGFSQIAKKPVSEECVESGLPVARQIPGQLRRIDVFRSRGKHKPRGQRVAARQQVSRLRRRIHISFRRAPVERNRIVVH